MALTVNVVDKGARNRASAGLGSWLARWAPKSAYGEVAVAIVPDRTMRVLNRRFRGVNEVTDVLSFPAGQRAEGRGALSLIPDPSSLCPFLGDIVIARGVAARQAPALGHRLRTELRVLALHGLLHLLGYDHEVDNGQMARVEARLRRRAGLRVGLIARSS